MLMLLGFDDLCLRFQGELQYFIGVQLDGSEYVEPERRRLSDNTEQASAKLVGVAGSLWLEPLHPEVGRVALNPLNCFRQELYLTP